MKKKVLDNQFAKGYVDVIKANEEEGRLGLAIISTETVDRQGDQIMADGWDFKAFKKNPLMLWSHNSGLGENRPAIGRVENVEVKEGKVYFEPVFDMKDQFAADIFRKFKEKFLNAFSIGFRPLEWQETDSGYKFVKQEALEFSAVNVPANQEALVVLRSEGMEVCKDFNEWKSAKPIAPDDEEDEDEQKDKEEKWKTFGDLQLAMFELFFKEIDEEKYRKLAEAYRSFGRIAPNSKHFKMAILRVAGGKKVGKRHVEVVNEEKLILNLLKGIATKLEVKA